MMMMNDRYCGFMMLLSSAEKLVSIVAPVRCFELSSCSITHFKYLCRRNLTLLDFHKFDLLKFWTSWVSFVNWISLWLYFILNMFAFLFVLFGQLSFEICNLYILFYPTEMLDICEFLNWTYLKEDPRDQISQNCLTWVNFENHIIFVLDGCLILLSCLIEYLDALFNREFIHI